MHRCGRVIWRKAREERPVMQLHRIRNKRTKKNSALASPFPYSPVTADEGKEGVITECFDSVKKLRWRAETGTPGNFVIGL
jgi:hypothetical protein